MNNNQGQALTQPIKIQQMVILGGHFYFILF